MFIDAFDSILESRFTHFFTFLMYLSSILIEGGYLFLGLRLNFFKGWWWCRNLGMLTKTDSILSSDLEQNELQVQHHQQRTDLVIASLVLSMPVSKPVVIVRTFQLPSLRMGLFFCFCLLGDWLFSLFFAETANPYEPIDEGKLRLNNT